MSRESGVYMNNSKEKNGKENKNSNLIKKNKKSLVWDPKKDKKKQIIPPDDHDKEYEIQKIKEEKDKEIERLRKMIEKLQQQKNNVNKEKVTF